jgi:hypothetical protein
VILGEMSKDKVREQRCLIQQTAEIFNAFTTNQGVWVMVIRQDKEFELTPIVQ